VACFRVVGRDVGGLCGRVSIDTIAGQDFLPSQSPALLGLKALVLNPIGGYVMKMSVGAKIFEEDTGEAGFIDIWLRVPGRLPRLLRRR
jgi:hypothetical protein